MDPYILIIENNLINRELAGSILEKAGIDVRYASDVLSGLIMLTKIRPSLILIGLTLPGMDGVILSQILRNDPDTSDLTIVALVDFSSSDDFDRSLTKFDGHIAVPFDEETLITKVNYFLEKNIAIQNKITL